MNEQLKQHLDRLPDLCLRYGVRRLALFGSATGDDFDPNSSDLDFLVEFEHSEKLDPAEQYFGLKAALEKCFSRPVDLIEPHTVRNPFIRRAIDQSKVDLYGERFESLSVGYR